VMNTVKTNFRQHSKLFFSLLCRLANEKRGDEVFACLAQMKSQIESDLSMKEKLTFLNQLLPIFGSTGQIPQMLTLFQQFTDFGSIAQTRTFNILIESLGANGRLHDAVQMLYTMLTQRCSPDHSTFTALLVAIHRSWPPSPSSSSSSSSSPSSSSLLWPLELVYVLEQVWYHMTVLHQLTAKESQYEALLAGLCKAAARRKIIHWIEQMRGENLEWTKVGFLSVVELWLDDRRVREQATHLKRILTNGQPWDKAEFALAQQFFNQVRLSV